eukprot:gene5237-5290_t
MQVCAPTWHPVLRPRLESVRLTLLIGGYSQARYLGKGAMTERVLR